MPDGRVREKLTRGARIREALRQSQHMPFRLIDEVVLMLAVKAELFDSLPLSTVATFRSALPAFLDESSPKALSDLAEAADLDDTVRAHLMDALTHLATSLAGEKTEAHPDTTIPVSP